MGVDLFGAERPNPASLLTTLALINVNWETHQKSYLDNFVPFLVEVMRKDPSQKWSDTAAKEQLAENFGLMLPTRVVETLLKRATRQGLAVRDHNRYSLTAQGKANAAHETFSARKTEAVREQKNLAKSLADLARRRFSLSWSDEMAEEALAAYIETNAVPLLMSTTRGDAVGVMDQSVGRDYVVSAFVAEIAFNEPTQFQYLERMVTGSMMASALYRLFTEGSGLKGSV